MVKPSERLAHLGHEDVVSDSSPREDQPPAVNEVVNEDEVIDPDPIRWALPANGEPIAERIGIFDEVQLVHMNHLGHKVGWSLREYQNDRTILTRICSEIGIDRNQFRAWVFRKKPLNDNAGSSSAGSGGSGDLDDEGSSSPTV